MNESGQIKVEELRTAINRIFDHLRDGGITVVPLIREYYWTMGTEDLYDVTKEPSELEIGNLFDDWEFVQKLGRGESEPVVLQLAEISPLLLYISEAVSELDLSSASTNP